jgi:tetratricopeptide (TPR) repeat protein
MHKNQLLIFGIGAAVFSAVLSSPAQNKPAKAKVTAPTIRPVSKLALVARLAGPVLFTGDPLTIRVRIDSPQARQDAFLAQRAREQKITPVAPTFQAPRIDADWTNKLIFTVFAVKKDGLLNPVLENLDWAACLVPAAADTLAGVSLGTRPREWIAVPEQAALGEGAYVLRVVWKGKGVADDALLKTDGTLSAPDFPFVVKAPADADEKVEHARRLALFEFGRKDYAKALAQAKAVINADPPFNYEIGEIYLVAAASQAAKKDFRAARDTYKTVLQWLPAKGEYTEMVKDMLAYVEAQLAPLPKR